MASPDHITSFGNRHGKRDLSGCVFGRLTVIRKVESSSDGQSRWLCLCQCGQEVERRGPKLRRGDVQSCGCLRKENAKSLKFSHGESNGNATPEYWAWKHIKQRCYDTKDKQYKDYGGRGITVCDRWLDSYESFIEDMGRRPSSKHTIERVDNSLGYSPENCVWATRFVQARNKRNNRLLTFQGETKCLREWTEILKINYQAVLARLDRGWSDEEALSTPIMRRKTNGMGDDAEKTE